MKRLLILLLLTVSCATEPVEVEEKFTCPELINLPEGVLGTLENPFQGDILVNQTKQAGVITALWEDKIVLIYFDKRWGEEQKKAVRKALVEYNLLGFTFPEITSEIAFSQDAPDHIFIKYSGVAASHIGKKGGQQEMYLPVNWLSHGTIVHEFGHAVGLHHPHVTDMQDEWLTIYWDNIREEHKFFFRTYSQYDENYSGQRQGFEYGDEYDIYSVMGYPSNAYAIDLEKPTMTLKDGTWFEGGETLSELDKVSIDRMYECFKNNKL